jgi:plasmid stability protein
MPTLHVRNVPEDLYERIRRLAVAEKRSLSAQVVVLLESAVERQAAPPGPLFERIRRRREQIERAVGKLPSSVDLLREDRAR